MNLLDKQKTHQITVIDVAAISIKSTKQSDDWKWMFGALMKELKFQKLTPTQEVDLSGYEEAFRYISRKRILEILLFSEYTVQERAMSLSRTRGSI